MNRGLLLSVVASTLIYAGGDIAPVEPAAPASADFWGQIGFAYQMQDDNFGTWAAHHATPEYSFGDKENNAFSTTVVLGVEKELGAGFGFGAELAGWTDFGLDIADNAKINDQSWRHTDQTMAEVSQAYLTYSFGNTAIKAGRQALPQAVSPWAWSDRIAGVLDMTYDGIVLANTDLSDTTLVGAWIANATDAGDTIHIGKDSNGLFMLGMINKSLSNTTLTLTGYYIPDSDINTYWPAATRELDRRYDTSGYPYGANKLKPMGTTAGDTWSIWASAVGSYDRVNWGVQFAYVDGDSKAWTKLNIPGKPPYYYMNMDATYAVAAKVGSRWGDFSAELIAGYINDGTYSLRTAGSAYSTSAFWTDNEEIGDTYGISQYALLAKAAYKVGIGSLYGSLGYWDYDGRVIVAEEQGATYAAFDSSFGARLGYKFNLAGVDSKIEYRYRKRFGAIGDTDQTRQRIRVEAYYRF